MSRISPIEGFSWMDVVGGSKAKEGGQREHAIYDMNDPRLHDKQLHSRTAGWLQSALSGKELKAEAKAAGCYLEGSRKVLALRLAFKNLSAPDQAQAQAGMSGGAPVASSSTTAAKRKRADVAESAPGRAKKGKTAKGDELLTTLAGIDYDEGPIYDSCPEIRRKSTAFLTTGAMTQTTLLKHLGVQSKSFCSFMKTKAVPGTGPKDWRVRGQAGAGNRYYPKAYHFFERLRLAQGKPKTPTRLKNELALAPSDEHTEYVEMGMMPAAGCNLKHDNGMRYSFGARTSVD